jgi:peptide/nickel transport system substrate-binding protein
VTSADVKFTAEYCMAPDGGCAQSAKFDGVESIDTPDDLTIVVNFDRSEAGSLRSLRRRAVTGHPEGPVRRLPRRQGAGMHLGQLRPGRHRPFVVTDFKPNDVITMKANENYRDPAKPAFATLTFKGGGDAAAAGRAVMETGEFDYAWNLQLAPEVIAKMAEGGKGTSVSGFGTLVERIEMNHDQPVAGPATGNERATRQVRTRFFRTNAFAVQALSMAIDRNLLVEIGYGQAGPPTCNWFRHRTLRIRQHRLPDAGHRRRQGAA